MREKQNVTCDERALPGFVGRLVILGLTADDCYQRRPMRVILDGTPKAPCPNQQNGSCVRLEEKSAATPLRPSRLAPFTRAGESLRGMGCGLCYVPRRGCHCYCQAGRLEYCAGCTSTAP